MGQVYWAAYDCYGEVPVAVTDERLADPEAVTAPERDSWFGAGHGLSAYPVIVERLAKQLSGFDDRLLPRASDIARLAAVELSAGKGLDAARGLPVYLRDDVVHRR
jgi:tRNA threonylcarbamoyladenosine biosynthesis protein TsaB